ncbi:MAG: hypothetical protein KJ970_19895 [Candidatus Eisenbacteria bacterium]|uniref:Tetratricopeptide repeat protein n=1 Tax=Eiseniibacteriota bacterium TaxID=2212470 RepID=A0A948RY61_UNCEI|nr:hypothetical protein [Candidatus Eisenbacteria bacterium]MBU1950325.1 hypothetical protein [Candidatus Eisenbacteria bacterium]MBU2693185.1 hypothetical protein [Candidatus Eisenbacteria bacterium]
MSRRILFLLLLIPIFVSCQEKDSSADIAGGLVIGSMEPVGRPPVILSWRHQILDRERYKALADEWFAYVKEHPKEPEAWIEWGDALRYSDRRDEAERKYAKAFEVDSTNAAAIVAHCAQMLHEKDNDVWKLAHERLLRATHIDPKCADIYYSLWITSLRSRDEETAQECLKRLVRLGDMSSALFNYGRNMIAGAPQNAIIFTNGDNDTYPPLAYQAISGDRTDVSIVNLSLLNTTWYISYLRDKGLPIDLDDAAINELKNTPESLIGAQIQRRLYERVVNDEIPRPLYYAVTVNKGNRALEYRTVLEGLLERIVPGGESTEQAPELDLARTRELFDSVYRIDGMTDLSVDWERESSLAGLAFNYAGLLDQLGSGLINQGSLAVGGPYLVDAIEIWAFHGKPERAASLIEMMEEKDPNSKFVKEAREIVENMK